jgi:hypothetical protein
MGELRKGGEAEVRREEVGESLVWMAQGWARGSWEDHRANQGCPVALGHEDGEVREGRKIENSELRCLFDVPEICFGKN